MSYRLRWKGQITGPHSLEELRAMLAAGQVSRMHQVDDFGQWRPLDEFLREAEQAERTRLVEAAAEEEAERQRREEQEREEEAYRASASAPEPPYEAPPNSFYDPEDFTESHTPRTSSLAVTAFVVSFASFIPFVNLVSWVPTLIMAHTALAEMERDPYLGGRGFAHAAIVISCTMLLIGVIVLVVVGFGFVKW